QSFRRLTDQWPRPGDRILDGISGEKSTDWEEEDEKGPDVLSIEQQQTDHEQQQHGNDGGGAQRHYLLQVVIPPRSVSLLQPVKNRVVDLLNPVRHGSVPRLDALS